MEKEQIVLFGQLDPTAILLETFMVNTESRSKQNQIISLKYNEVNVSIICGFI